MKRRLRRSAPGTMARVRLRGSDETFPATVEALRGAGSQRATGLLAAEPENLTEGSLSVMLRLAPANVRQRPESRRISAMSVALPKCALTADWATY